MEKRVEKTVLNFKTKKSDEVLTARSGLSLVIESSLAFGVDKLLDQHLPEPLSNRGFSVQQYVLPLIMMIYGGGKSISDMREIRNDKALREICNLDVVPSDSAIGDWLRRLGKKKGVRAFEKVNDEFMKSIIKLSQVKNGTLVIDPTIIKSEKRDAKMTYLGHKGYRPAYASVPELGLITNYKFKEGNDNGGRAAFVKESVEKTSEVLKLKRFLADSEYYVAEIFNYLNKQNLDFIIAAQIDSSSKKAIESIDEDQWEPFKDKYEVAQTGVEIAETVHTMEKTEDAFRLIVKRWKNKDEEICYHAVATNINTGTSRDIVLMYNNRANIENVIKESKNGFGMDRMPSGAFLGNAIYFALGILCYNLFIAQKIYTMPDGYRKKTISSIRWLLIETPSKLVNVLKNIVLEISTTTSKYKDFCEIRKKNYEIYQLLRPN